MGECTTTPRKLELLQWHRRPPLVLTRTCRWVAVRTKKHVRIREREARADHTTFAEFGRPPSLRLNHGVAEVEWHVETLMEASIPQCGLCSHRAWSGLGTGPTCL